MEPGITLPPWAAGALERLEAGGFEAWCVGGCVRDSLLGLSPGDWDLTTNALPEQIKACFPGFPTVDTGIRHGTVAVLWEGKPVEITTYRSDGAYADHRHPDRVAFSQRLEEDLSRRDFTINALAYHPLRGLRDPFGGLADLKRHTLRCVGDPDRRFQEDALRILRCLRFSAVLGFSIDQAAAQALERNRELLGAVSHERVREELSKLLAGRDAGKVLREHSETVFTVLPELAPLRGCAQETPYHCLDVWEHTLRALDSAPAETVLRWAALLHDCGKPGVKTYGPDGTAHFYGHAGESARIAQEILDRLRFDHRSRDEILSLVKLHGEAHPIPERRLKRLLARLGPETLHRLFALSRADLAAQAPGLSHRLGAIAESEALAEEILQREDCLTLRELAINGSDLLALGFSPGPELGAALGLLLDRVLDGALPNEKTALLRKAEELLHREREDLVPGKEITHTK